MWTQSVLGVILYVHIVYIILYVENFTENIARCAQCTWVVCGFILYLYYIYTIIRTSCTLKRRQLNRYCALRNAHGAAVVVGGKGMEAVIYK